MPHLYVKKILMDLSHFEAWDSDASFRFLMNTTTSSKTRRRRKGRGRGRGRRKSVCLTAN